MRIQVLLSIVLFLLISVSGSFAQGPIDDVELLRIADSLRAESQAAKQAAENRAAELEIPIVIYDENGGKSELMRFDENGMPVYFTTDNWTAGRTISTNKVYPSGGAGFDLTGSGILLAQWDGGIVRTSHREFVDNGVSRVSNRDNADISQHSTHVAGTMISEGVLLSARGMAYEAVLEAYDWDDDTAEMLGAAADGLLLSNHSYGVYAGWSWSSQNAEWYWYGDVTVSQTKDYKFGYYNDEARNFDFIASLAKDYLIFCSAGNDRDDAVPAGTAHYYWDGSRWLRSNSVRDNDGDPGGYDCLRGKGNAKNVVTVGAIKDISTGWSEPDDAVITDFSNYGPTDDGRIKPDIVANGYLLYSCDSHSSNDQYIEKSGTSMSCPSACGSAGLIVEYNRKVNGPGKDLKSSTLKGLIIHCADEAGEHDGPDYRFGWGLMNTESCVKHLEKNLNTGNSRLAQERVLSDGETETIVGKYTGEGPIKVTLCWTDPPAVPLTNNKLDNRTKMLVNDLDLRVKRHPVIYQPWVLDVDNPSDPATVGDNTTDNVEQVYIENPIAATYYIEINHKGALSADQEYSLIITGLERTGDLVDTDGNGYKEINNLGDLRYLSDNPSFWNEKYELTDDIDAHTTKYWNDGKGFSPIGVHKDTAFTGKFEGNGHQISFLHINRPGEDYNGLFGYLDGSETSIRNLEFYDFSVTGGNYTGGLVGYLKTGQIDSCFVDGIINSSYNYTGGAAGYVWFGKITDTHTAGKIESEGQYAGGLAGYCHGPTTHGCSSSSNVQGNVCIGGLVGYNYLGDILLSSASGQVSGKQDIGGLVGNNNNATIINSQASGTVYYHIADDMTATAAYDAGGLIGENYFGHISNCHANGIVSGYTNVGGLIGHNRYSDVYKCYSSGSVSLMTGAGNIGGMIGEEVGTCDIENCFWDVDTSGESDSDGGTGKSTAEMTQSSTFTNADWNFDFIWEQKSGQYPEIDINTSYLPDDADGDGYRDVSSLTDLVWISESYYSLDDKWELTADINASSSSKLHNGKGFMPVGIEPKQASSSVINVFDGKGYTISNLTVNRKYSEKAGLFGKIASGDTVKNLILDNLYIRGARYTGGLAGVNHGEIYSCKTSGTVISTNYNVGGLVGHNSLGTVKYSASDATVSGSRTVGGLIGLSYVGTISDCYARGTATGTSDRVGGLIGKSDYDNISYCYSTGKPSGTLQVGGLIGYCSNTTDKYTFWDTQTSATSISDAGTGKTSAQMKTESTYTKDYWNFKTVWDMTPGINDGYPYLKIFETGDITHSIPLKQRWNMVSAFVLPENNDFDTVTADIEANVFLAKNANGAVHLPAYDIRQIPNWNATEGYLLYMSNADTLKITGPVVPADTMINLAARWNMIAYPRRGLLTTEKAFGSISDNILLVKNTNGAVFFPAYGIDGIDTLRPGEGYLVYMIKSDILDFPYPDEIIMKPPTNEKKESEFSGSGLMSHVIIAEADLPDNSVLICENASATFYSASKFFDGRASLGLPADDPYTDDIDGIRDGEQLIFKIIPDGQSRTCRAEIIEAKSSGSEFCANTDRFETNGISIVKLNIESAPTDENTISVFPNPVFDRFEIISTVETPGDIEIVLYDMKGRRVKDLYEGPNKQTVRVENLDLPAGNYVVAYRSRPGVYYRKIKIAR